MVLDECLCVLVEVPGDDGVHLRASLLARPDEALAHKDNLIPSFVIEAVNTLLAQRFNGSNYCTIKQDEVIDLAMKIGSDAGTMPPGSGRFSFFDNRWLDFEPLYEKSGWKIEYDKPGFNESYSAFWRFWRAA